MRIDRRAPAAVTVTIAMALAAACGDRGDDRAAEASSRDGTPALPEVVDPGPVAESYAPELKVDLSKMTHTPVGTYVQDLEVGTGAEAALNDVVVAHYTGWLANGQQFDSSYDRGEPLTFPLNRVSVIYGWVDGLTGMKEGGKRKLVIPPGLAYGDRGAQGVIPPGATLVFDVELLDVRKPAPPTGADGASPSGAAPL